MPASAARGALLVKRGSAPAADEMLEALSTTGSNVVAAESRQKVA